MRTLAHCALGWWLLLAACTPTPDVAATPPTPTDIPNFGTQRLESGFLPDPYVITMQSGGQIDLRAQNIGESCRGFVTTEPDLRLHWSGDTDRLRIFFVSSGDTTLVVQTPDGQYICNDDFVSLDPAVELTHPPEGDYNIWVGSFSATEFVYGYLMITELGSMPGSIQSNLLVSGTPAAETDPPRADLDLRQPPSFGSMSLRPGAHRDPLSVGLLSGGSNDVSTLDVGMDCVGFTATPADYRIVLSAPVDFLRLFFVGDGDTTLVVHAPDGAWHCSDDSVNTLNPMVDFVNAHAGRYNIWVGSYSSSDLVGGTLYITQSTATDPTTFTPVP
jgi:hypothetical protein